jgi:hypothetical protein
MRTTLLLALAFCSAWLPPAHAGTTLITEQEASLPVKPNIPFDRRAITRAPQLELVQPGESSYSPMRFQIKFLAFGGARIDPSKLRVTYLKTPEIDITPRVIAFAKPTGIDIPDAEVPPGDHFILVEIADTEGRIRASVLSLKIQR